MNQSITKSWLARPDWWFHSTKETDREVIKFFGNFHELYPITDLDSVIIYDQLARHYFRDDIFNFMKYTPKALEYTGRLLIGDLGRFSPEEFVFILLPLRHTKRADKIELALKYLYQHPKYKEHPSIFVRFYKASIEQLSKFHGYFMETFTNYEFDESEWSRFDILEHIPSKSMPIYCAAVEEDINYLKRHRIQSVLISLSGGVDSMVLLRRFHAASNSLNIPCEAVHINYGNRGATNEMEIDLLRAYCGKMGVKLTVRHIREIHRTKDHLRDFYEEITRSIRFEMYRLLGQHNRSITLLGHHQDDAVENILSNVRKGRNWDNLMGMEEVYHERGVLMGRPFLGLSKQQIIDFAVENHLPYLCDSTPSWSERGRMRDNVIPALNTFSNQCHGLIHMSKEMTRLMGIISTSLWNPFRSRVEYTTYLYTDKKMVIIPYEKASFEWGLPFWHGLLIDIARYMKVAYPSKRSIQNFVRVAASPNFNHRNKNQVDLSKDLRVVIPYNQDKIYVCYMS